MSCFLDNLKWLRLRSKVSRSSQCCRALWAWADDVTMRTYISCHDSREPWQQEGNRATAAIIGSDPMSNSRRLLETIHLALEETSHHPMQ